MKVLLSLILSLIYFPLSAEIIECNHFKEILPYVKEGDTLFMEIDNVLLNSKEELGTTSYFNHLKQEMLKQGFETDEIINKLYDLWVRVQKKSEMELSDPNLLDYFFELERQNIGLVGLSHRGASLALHTHEILYNLGLFFQASKPFCKDKFLEEGLATFFQGILFVHPICDKGEYILKLCEEFEHTPGRVVCIDYELVNLINVRQALEEKGIPFLGIYFKNHDLNLSDYTIQVGNMQLSYLDRILPDSKAKILAESNR